MMRLRKLNTGAWTVVAVVGADGSCDLELEMAKLANDRKTKATAGGFVSMWDLIPAAGPRTFSDDWYRQLDKEHDIWEFRRRDHRILCFEADGRIVVCSHLMPKKSQRTPKRDIERAIELRRQYLSAARTGGLEFED